MALVVEAGAEVLRGVLFARVAGQQRFVTDATCERGPSLSAAIEELATMLAARTGLAAGQIQRDPVFVVTDPDDLANQSLVAIDRRHAIALSCTAVARTRGTTVSYIEARRADEHVAVVRAEQDGRPAIETRPATASHDETDEARAALIEDCRRALHATGGAANLVIAGEPFAAMPPGVAMLALADIAQAPAGRMEIVIDRDAITSVAGALDEASMTLVVASDLLPASGLVLTVEGYREPGLLAVRGSIATPDGRRARFSVPYGSVELLAPRSWRGGTVRIVGQDGATIGGERIVRVATDCTANAQILIDARGPARLAPASEARPASWLADVGESATGHGGRRDENGPSSGWRKGR